MTTNNYVNIINLIKDILDNDEKLDEIFNVSNYKVLAEPHVSFFFHTDKWQVYRALQALIIYLEGENYINDQKKENSRKEKVLQ